MIQSGKTRVYSVIHDTQITLKKKSSSIKKKMELGKYFISKCTKLI